MDSHFSVCLDTVFTRQPADLDPVSGGGLLLAWGR